MYLTQPESRARQLCRRSIPSAAVTRGIARNIGTAVVLAVAGWLLPAPPAWAAECANKNAQITPNYKDADLGQIVEAVSELTCKNFIVDPRVRAQVTVISATPMNPQEFYETFLAVLQVNGFIAVPAGKVYKITLKPWYFAHQFAPGHRLAIRLTNDLFPQYARLPGTGESLFTATKYVRSTNTVYKSAKYPSRVRFATFAF